MGELYHHGILGQKWGKRNGPPYPLGVSDHSASERKAGWKASLAGSSKNSYNKESSNEEEFHLTDKQKKVIKIGVAATGVALATVGGVYLAKSGKLNGIIEFGKSKTKQMLGTNEIDQSTGLRKIVGKESDFKRLKKCNPNFKQSNYVTPYNRNCGNTVIADELRKRGLDVEARGNNWGMTASNMEQFFDGIDDTAKKEMKISIPDLSHNTKMNLQFGVNRNSAMEVINRGKSVRSEFIKEITNNYPDGSRGCMLTTSMYGSHWISWSLDKGKVKFTNPQNPKENLLFHFGLHADLSQQGGIPTTIRLDNLKVNKNNIKDIVMDYGSDADAKGMTFNPLQSIGKIPGVNDRDLKTIFENSFGSRWDGTWKYFDPRTGQRWI